MVPLFPRDLCSRPRRELALDVRASRRHTRPVRVLGAAQYAWDFLRSGAAACLGDAAALLVPTSRPARRWCSTCRIDAPILRISFDLGSSSGLSCRPLRSSVSGVFRRTGAWALLLLRTWARRSSLRLQRRRHASSICHHLSSPAAGGGRRHRGVSGEDRAGSGHWLLRYR
jgi:hypothetical protein